MKARKIVLVLPLLLPLLMSNSVQPDQFESDNYSETLTQDEYRIEDDKLIFNCDNKTDYFIKGTIIMDETDNQIAYSSQYNMFGYLVPPNQSGNIIETLYNGTDISDINGDITVQYSCYDLSKPQSRIENIEATVSSYDTEDDLTYVDINYEFTDLDDFNLHTAIFYFYDSNIDAYVYGSDYIFTERFKDESGHYVTTITLPGKYESLDNYVINYKFTIENGDGGFGLMVGLYSILGIGLLVIPAVVVFIILLVRMIFKYRKI